MDLKVLVLSEFIKYSVPLLVQKRLKQFMKVDADESCTVVTQRENKQM